jgi:tRNA dimethylallyltransferase
VFCINKFKNYKEIKIEKLILYKNRQTLYNNASLRFDSMIQKGAIGEVANYLNKIKEFILNSDEINTIEALTSYKTLGVREIEKYLTGLINFEEMSSLIKQKTRNYIKHQDTWFRNKFKDFTLI